MRFTFIIELDLVAYVAVSTIAPLIFHTLRSHTPSLATEAHISLYYTSSALSANALLERNSISKAALMKSTNINKIVKRIASVKSVNHFLWWENVE